MDINAELLPPNAQEWAEVIGLDGVLHLVDCFRGRKLKVPKKLDMEHPIAQCLGPVNFKKFWQIYQGEPIDVPMIQAAKRQLIWQSVMSTLSDGITRADTAYQHNMTERNVYKIQQRMLEQDDTQEELF